MTILYPLSIFINYKYIIQVIQKSVTILTHGYSVCLTIEGVSVAKEYIYNAENSFFT